jgi:lipid A ethanolaminephosphotransferase
MKAIGALTARPYSSNALIVMVAVYVALFANTALFRSAFSIYNRGTEEVLFAASLLPFIAAIFVVILSALCHRATAKPVLITFLLLSALVAFFMNRYGVVIDDDMLLNVLETDSREARDLLNLPLVLYVLVLGVVPSLFIYKVTMNRPGPKAALISRLQLVSTSLAVVVGLFFSFSGHYTSMFREHKEVWYRVNPIHPIYSAGRLVNDSVTFASLPHLIVGANAKIPETDVHRELVIMVVGETARADHFSLNGYERETNPRLQKEEVINFPDFWS